MQREMDFTDLIDWGRGADSAAVAPSRPRRCTRLLGLLQLVAPEVFIISKGDQRRRRARFISKSCI